MDPFLRAWSWSFSILFWIWHLWDFGIEPEKRFKHTHASDEWLVVSPLSFDQLNKNDGFNKPVFGNEHLVGGFTTFCLTFFFSFAML